MEPTDMSAKHSDANTVLSGRVHRVNNPAANERMPKSVWQPGMVQRLADYIKHLREVDQQSDKPHVADLTHQCPRHPERTCNCTGTCADDDATDRKPLTGSAVFDAKYTCPISGVICFGIKCREWCESGVNYSKT